MNRGLHISEQEMIGHLLCDEVLEQISLTHLHECVQCQQIQKSVTDTLDEIELEPRGYPDPAQMWRALEPTLFPRKSAVSYRPKLRWFSQIPVLGCAAALVLIVVLSYHVGFLRSPQYWHPESKPGGDAPLQAGAESPARGTSLDDAERLLTVLAHASGSVDPETRAEMKATLANNSEDVAQASQRGDFEEATILGDLGVLLINLGADDVSSDGRRNRLQQISSVLVDVRVLQQSREGLHDSLERN